MTELFVLIMPTINNTIFWGTYDLRTDWKGLNVRVGNHTKIANSGNKQKSKRPSLISPSLGGEKEKWVKQGYYYNLILNRETKK